jgi:hypothetical protein
MPVMTGRDEREKLKRVSPFFDHYRASSHSMDQEKVECTRANGCWQGIASCTCSRVCGTGSLLSYCIQFDSGAHNHNQNGNYYQCCIHTVIMTMAIIVVLLFLFNRMMNVISMMDNFDANVISTQSWTIMPQSI